MATVFFESERLWFRPPDLDEAPLLQRWINDAAVRRQLNRRFPLGLEGEREWIRKATGQAGPTLPEVVALLFGVKGEAEPIGSTGLFGFDWVVREAEWGILIGAVERWGQGYGREVGRRLVRYAFEELNLNRVTLRVNATNPGGVKAYEAAGFVREGVLRQAAVAEGGWADVIAMAVLREEWRAP